MVRIGGRLETVDEAGGDGGIAVQEEHISPTGLAQPAVGAPDEAEVGLVPEKPHAVMPLRYQLERRDELCIRACVVDQNFFLAQGLAAAPGVVYLAPGRAVEAEKRP